MDLESTLQEYQIQLEQVELTLKNDPENEEVLKLKADLLEVIKLTEELIGETATETDDALSQQANKNKNANTPNKMGICKQIRWKSGDKCLALWREDGQYYPAVIDQIVEEDGSCTVIFDGYSTSEMTQVSLLMPRNKNAIINSNLDASNLLINKNNNSVYDNKKPLTKKELEMKLREAKKRKREKRTQKLKELEEISEKGKNKWKNFNTKLASRTWKGVVTKSKFELPDHHENKIGVGTNSVNNRLLTTNPSSASASAAAHLQNKKFKSS